MMLCCSNLRLACIVWALQHSYSGFAIFLLHAGTSPLDLNILCFHTCFVITFRALIVSYSILALGKDREGYAAIYNITKAYMGVIRPLSRILVQMYTNSFSGDLHPTTVHFITSHHVQPKPDEHEGRDKVTSSRLHISFPHTLSSSLPGSSPAQ